MGISTHQTISTNDQFGPAVATRQVSVVIMDVPSQPRFHKKKFVLPQPHTDDKVSNMHQEWNRIVCQGFICWQYVAGAYLSTCLRPDKESKKKKMVTDMSAPSLSTWILKGGSHDAAGCMGLEEPDDDAQVPHG